MMTGLVIGILIHFHESDLKNEEQINTLPDTITHEITVLSNTQKVENDTYDFDSKHILIVVNILESMSEKLRKQYETIITQHVLDFVFTSTKDSHISWLEVLLHL